MHWNRAQRGKTQVRIPRIVAAQRLQTWLLVMALLAIGATGLLVLDLIRNLRTVVISEANRALTTAVKELVQTGSAWDNRHRQQMPSIEKSDQELKSVSYEVLRSYPDVEGGFLLNDAVIGHSFPTYTEPGSTLRQPPLEHQEVLSALVESRRTGRIATRLAQEQKDIVLVAVLAHPGTPLAAWSLRRVFNFSDSSELHKRVVLVSVMLVALLAVGVVLKLSFSLQQGFAMVQAGLDRLRTDLNYRLPDQDHELRSVVRAVNAMAESRQKLEAALRREDRLRVMGRVVAGIAHEIRNPLNSIRLTIRVLARRLHSQPEATESVQLVIGEIDRLDALLKSLLAFRPDEPPKIRQQPLQPILERTLALVKPHASEREVAIHVQGAVESKAAVDSDFLQQALINLLLNAIDASGRAGSVEVILQPANSHLEILIEDSGPGLTPEQQDRLFEAFYTTKPGGTGLGLAVTKTLLDNMGAGIEYFNGTNGARFRVVLPVGESA
jgi:signal transduction histidine kinase